MNIKNCCILKKLLNHNAHKDYTFLGKGFTLEDKKGEHFIPIFLEDNNRCNHSFIFGAPGVGKTRLLEAMIEQDIPKGNNIVVIDPKGDIDLFSKIYQCAKLSGREKDVLFLSPVYPQYSIQ
ncbi:type IV secretion system DNA-binding domain-containing protein, partial [Campylobacter upsaliensis]|nr:type IV secretion system DNA-binding domain-containing protein [Campylobacter upsaliensis]